MSKETTDQIVRMLTEERDRINRAIEALTAGIKRRGRPPKDAAAIVHSLHTSTASKKR